MDWLFRSFVFSFDFMILFLIFKGGFEGGDGKRFCVQSFDLRLKLEELFDFDCGFYRLFIFFCIIKYVYFYLKEEEQYLKNL